MQGDDRNVFLRKLTVLLVPLLMLLVICVLIPLFAAMDKFFGPLLLGACTGIMLALLLPLAGATKYREPFAWLLWIPAAIVLLVLLYQFLAQNQTGQNLPVLRLLATGDSRIIITEAAFAAYMLTFSVRTGKGI